jgi:hypothetical protein
MASGKTSEKKFSDYRNLTTLINGLLKGIDKLTDASTEESVKSFVDDIESSCSYTDSGNPGFLGSKVVHTKFKQCLGPSKWRVLFDDVMLRPNIKAAWDAAMVQETLYMADLLVDTAHPGDEEAPGDFAAVFYTLFRSAFLQHEDTPWHVLHHTKHDNPLKRQGALDVAAYYEKIVSRPARKEALCPEWPADAARRFGASLDANILFANADPHIRAAMLNNATYRALIPPATMSDWDLSAIYVAMRAISLEPAFLEAKKERVKLQKLSAIQVVLAAQVSTRSRAPASDPTVAGSAAAAPLSKGARKRLKKKVAATAAAAKIAAAVEGAGAAGYVHGPAKSGFSSTSWQALTDAEKKIITDKMSQIRK